MGIAGLIESITCLRSYDSSTSFVLDFGGAETMWFNACFGKNSEVPNVVFSYTVITSSPVFSIVTGTFSSAKLKKTLGTTAFFKVLIHATGSNRAGISVNGRCHSSIRAGKIMAYPAGTETVSVATTRKTVFTS